MRHLRNRALATWASFGTRVLPFADAASADLPLSRLLRLSLFQVSVGMALVLLVGTLNRVMIVELNVPAAIVAIMVSLPLVFAPLRLLIGFRSDTHVSALGWRRVPFIWKGTMLQFGGLSLMPFALLVLAGGGESGQMPAWIGQLAAAVSFLLVGAGLHMVQTVGLALATDLAPLESQPKVVGLMYVMLLVGMIISSIVFGAALVDFSPARLVSVIQSAAVLTLVLNVVGLWKQETRSPGRSARVVCQEPPAFAQSWDHFIRNDRNAARRLAIVGLGTMGFTMGDVLLEPYGGQVLHLSVGSTTWLTATLAIGGLFGFAWASRVLSRGLDPLRMANYGALVGVPAFAIVILSAPTQSTLLFGLGTLLIGFGGGLFGHGTLTATMQLAPAEQTGLSLGAWGAVQASAAGIAIALGGIIKDIVPGLPAWENHGPATGYIIVYGLEIALLAATAMAVMSLLRSVDNAASPRSHALVR